MLTRAVPDPLLVAVDQIYASIESPELWPNTICVIADCFGIRRDFWVTDGPLGGHSEDINRLITPGTLRTKCTPSFFLSRTDLQARDEYTREFGELIVRFLKLVFLSMFWSPKTSHAREAIGLMMTRRYLQVFDALGSATSKPPKLGARNFIAALWEEGCMFREEHLQSMRHLAPHLDRALRLQMRLRTTDLQTNKLSGVLDQLTLGVVIVNSEGLRLWQNRRAREVFGCSNVVRLNSEGFTGRTPADTRALRQLAKGAISTKMQNLLAVPRGENLRPLLLTAVSLN